MFWLKGKIEKNNNFTKGQEKKLKIKIMRAELKNILPLIWIERWNWKQIKFLQNDQDQK